jgi:acyl-CoA thioester hydrolase
MVRRHHVPGWCSPSYKGRALSGKVPNRSGTDADRVSSHRFQIRFTVRSYEVDSQGHLNSAIYHQYGEHVRWEMLRAAAIPRDRLLHSGLGPVVLECTIRFHRELRLGDEVDVSCAYCWGEGKTFRLTQEYRQPDGTLMAGLVTVCGLIDLTERRLVPDPGKRLRSLASAPEVLGL